MRLSILIVLLYSCSHAQVEQKNTWTKSNTDSTQLGQQDSFKAKQAVLADSQAAEATIVNRDSTNPVKPTSNSLIVHAFVPLCDNENQGIAPVSASLGNGLNLNTNLYWGAMYGVKSYFKRQSGWILVSSKKNINSHILERVIFKKKNGTKTIYLVADAYRGDKMKECLEDFFSSTSGVKSDSIKIENTKYGIHSSSDLLIFNGHNGLMDSDVDMVNNSDGKQRQAAAIGCISDPYFSEYFAASKAKPVLTTTNLLAPEAYVMEALILSWSEGKSSAEIRNRVGAAYHKYQKCGLNGAKKLFKTAD